MIGSILVRPVLAAMMVVLVGSNANAACAAGPPRCLLSIEPSAPAFPDAFRVVLTWRNADPRVHAVFIAPSDNLGMTIRRASEPTTDVDLDREIAHVLRRRFRYHGLATGLLQTAWGFVAAPAPDGSILVPAGEYRLRVVYSLKVRPMRARDICVAWTGPFVVESPTLMQLQE